MSRNQGIVLVVAALWLAPLHAQDFSEAIDPTDAVALVDPCPDEPCGCNGPDPIDTTTYFIPNYAGWQNAKKIWTEMSGGTNYFRFFQYSSDDYELIKCANGTCTETFEVTPAWIYVTSEMGPQVLQSSSRVFLGNGLKFIPRVLCTNKPTFRPCHEGEQLINATSCLPTGTTPSHCFTYSSRIDRVNWNYGGSLGIVDTLIKTDRLDNGEYEKYWYGLGKGLLRWEHRSSSNQLLNYGQQTGLIMNSPISHNSCVQPQ